MKPLPFCARVPAIISSVTCTSVSDVHALDDRWLTATDGSPDVVEWRADQLAAALGGEDDLGDKIAEVARALSARAELPLILTARSDAEGGACPQRVYRTVVDALLECARKDTKLAVDVEIERPDASDLIATARAQGTHVVASFHDFEATPDGVFDRLHAMEQAGASVAKIAVTPHTMDDVLTVLHATNRAHTELSIPVIAISMGRMGAVTRLMGAEFGSCATFATGPQGASAPGQYTVAQVKQIRDMLDAD